MSKCWRTRVLGLRALIPLVVVSVLFLAPSSALADAPQYQTAFQGQDGNLWTAGSDGQSKDWQFGMASGTSPSIAALAGGGYEMAIQTNTGVLVTADQSGNFAGWASMAPGTSPTIAALPWQDDSWEAAIQDANGWLDTIDARGQHQSILSMAPDTSPSIAAGQSGSWVVAAHGDNGDLWTADSTGAVTDSVQEMAPGTSPSIAYLAGGGWEAAFQGKNGDLWTMDESGNATDTQLASAPGTSPGITALPGGGWEATYQATTGDQWTDPGGPNPFYPGGNHLWTVTSDGHADDGGGGMQAGTSPSIAALPSGDVELAWNANSLFNDGPGGFTSQSTYGSWLWLAPGTDPAITCAACAPTPSSGSPPSAGDTGSAPPPSDGSTPPGDGSTPPPNDGSTPPPSGGSTPAPSDGGAATGTSTAASGTSTDPATGDPCYFVLYYCVSNVPADAGGDGSSTGADNTGSSAATDTGSSGGTGGNGSATGKDCPPKATDTSSTADAQGQSFNPQPAPIKPNPPLPPDPGSTPGGVSLLGVGCSGPCIGAQAVVDNVHGSTIVLLVGAGLPGELVKFEAGPAVVGQREGPSVSIIPGDVELGTFKGSVEAELPLGSDFASKVTLSPSAGSGPVQVGFNCTASQSGEAGCTLPSLQVDATKALHLGEGELSAILVRIPLGVDPTAIEIGQPDQNGVYRVTVRTKFSMDGSAGRSPITYEARDVSGLGDPIGVIGYSQTVNADGSWTLHTPTSDVTTYGYDYLQKQGLQNVGRMGTLTHNVIDDTWTWVDADGKTTITKDANGTLTQFNPPGSEITKITQTSQGVITQTKADRSTVSYDTNTGVFRTWTPSPLLPDALSFLWGTTATFDLAQNLDVETGKSLPIPDSISMPHDPGSGASVASTGTTTTTTTAASTNDSPCAATSNDSGNGTGANGTGNGTGTGGSANGTVANGSPSTNNGGTTTNPADTGTTTNPGTPGGGGTGGGSGAGTGGGSGAGSGAGTGGGSGGGTGGASGTGTVVDIPTIVTDDSGTQTTSSPGTDGPAGPGTDGPDGPGNDGTTGTGNDGTTGTGNDGTTGTGNDGTASAGSDGSTSTGTDGTTSTGTDAMTSTGNDGTTTGDGAGCSQDNTGVNCVPADGTDPGEPFCVNATVHGAAPGNLSVSQGTCDPVIDLNVAPPDPPQNQTDTGYTPSTDEDIPINEVAWELLGGTPFGGPLIAPVPELSAF